MKIQFHTAKIKIDDYFCINFLKMIENNSSKFSIASVCREAFGYWWKTIGYQMLFGIIYFSIFISVIYYAAGHLGLLEPYLAASDKVLTNNALYIEEMRKIYQSDAYQSFYWIFIGTSVFLFPLNLGFYKIYRKMDLKEKVKLEDLFSGYQGINFFIYTGYYLFWVSVFNIVFPTLLLPFIWVFITLFSAPLTFFMKKTIFEGIGLSIKALRLYFIEIIICGIVALLFKYLGLFSLFGAIFTFSFWNAMIYALYKNIFTEVKN